MDRNLGSNRKNDEELRIVMVGKTGNGKSATGNTILGRKCFESEFSFESMTVDCSKVKAVVDGQQVTIIDTPGLFDTRFDMAKTSKDLIQCITYAAPGPHVFLVVIKLDRYTGEEKQTVQKIQEIFGQAADKYSMVLFTHGDILKGKSIEDFLKHCSGLQEVVERCNGQYHVFNNELKDRTQVTELLQKIRNVAQKNGGSHYTNEMFQEAERAIEVEQQRILKEKEEQIRKEKEKLERKLQEKYEKEMKKMNDQLRAEREEERKREKQRMDEDRERDKKEREEERKREKQQMDEMRKREREAGEEEIKRRSQQMYEDRERERKEREDERKRKQRDEQRERERKEQERERKEMEIKEQHDRELREGSEALQAKHEKQAREEAEESSILYALAKAGEFIVEGVKSVVGSIVSWFK